VDEVDQLLLLKPGRRVTTQINHVGNRIRVRRAFTGENFGPQMTGVIQKPMAGHRDQELGEAWFKSR
jgi:hypothetical protein